MEERERTLNKVNKETRMSGFPILSLILILTVILVLALNLPVSLFLTIPGAIYLLKKMKEAAKEGCPNYLSEQVKYQQVKRYFTSQTDIMQKLTKHDQG